MVMFEINLIEIYFFLNCNCGGEKSSSRIVYIIEIVNYIYPILNALFKRE